MFQLKNISTPEQLFDLATRMHEIASVKMEGDDPNTYVERLNELCAWVATSGKALSDAKYWRNREIKNSVLNALKDSKVMTAPASTINELIKASAYDLNYLVDFIEQIDKDFKYTIEGLRTIISLKKQEMSTQIYQR